jgi:ABC-2 type transport system ATP-binding protein
MEEAVIVAKNLVKHFPVNGSRNAVDGISLEIHAGEVYGVIGPDGAGKTTLTRLLIGLLSRTGGESSVLGFDSMRSPYEIRERIGYVAQQFTLPPELTVMENMLFFADTQGVTRESQQQRIAELLEFTGLSKFCDRLTSRLSGGMKKKLALSCSLIHDPSVLFLDEPTLGVDPVSRREFWTLLSSLRAERSMTILVCTPYMDEAERCSQIGLIYQGKMIASGAPDEIKNRVPGQLLEFTPASDRFDATQSFVRGMAGVKEVQTYGVMLHVFVDDAQRRREEIQTALAAHGLAWSDMRPIEPRMEEAFISLISRQQVLSVEVEKHV